MKKIMKPSLTNGAFVRAGDTVEFEVSYSTEKIIVSAVEINMKSGEAVIHGFDEKRNPWAVPARELVSVFNQKMTLEEEK